MKAKADLHGYPSVSRFQLSEFPRLKSQHLHHRTQILLRPCCLYQRQGGAITNFEQTLPQPQSDLVQQMIKDPYHLEFLPLGKRMQERDLENALVAHTLDFLMELGVGFAFVGSQYYLKIGGEDFYLDLLFYHLELRCFIIIGLKMGDFKAEYSGKMNLYISSVDEQMRKAQDNPAIGI